MGWVTPDTLHPPFVSTATQQPRQLQRWLDINPQGGPLGRTQTYITLPAFNVGVNWNGYSDIVVAFNFEGPNNFSLKSLSSLPVNPNYLLAISWRDGNGNMFRYALWNNVGEVIYFQLPLYTGQMIKKNFRLEVWSTNVANVSNAAPINFYTSVLGILDFRWGVDSALVVSDGQVTNFSTPLPPANVPPVATDWWKPSGILVFGGAFSDWNTSAGTGSVTQITNVPAINNTTPQSVGLTTAVLQFNLSSNVTQVKNFYFVVSQTTNNGVINFYTSGNAQVISITLSNGTGSWKLDAASGGNSGSCNIISGQVVGIGLSVNGNQGTFTAYDNTGRVTGTFTITLTNSVISYLQAGIVDQLYELFQTNTVFNFSNYLAANYGGFPLPLTFPANSVSQPN